MDTQMLLTSIGIGVGIAWTVIKLWDRVSNWALTALIKKVSEEIGRIQLQETYDLKAYVLEFRILMGIKYEESPDEIKKLHAEYEAIPTRDGSKRNGYLTYRVNIYLTPFERNKNGYYRFRKLEEDFGDEKECK